ncbi:MAG: hypothetical protein BWK79_01925 [Beggiatoa sp. IS2]|nr:MAG: hypothetical protein BWK79_01925 [Beggiatoa sp. IS2]
MGKSPNTSEDGLEPIAIIGIAGRFPGAKNLDEFWCNLRDGIESISHFSDEEAIAAGTDPELLKNPAFVKAHGVLDDMEMFDAAFFDMSPRDARILDPQHRIYLENAWETLENAGYNPETYQGRIGVYAGTSFSTYLLRNILPNKLINFPTIDRLEMALTNHKDTMPMRVSFHMNLTGPSICVGTTCSTSLVALHLACQALLTYQCDMALTGASFLRVPPKEGYLFQEGMIYSPDGHLRTFDAKTKGIVTGAGTGNVLLKRLDEALADGDYIHAIIKATALNNDGSTKVGYTAPSIDGQAEVIAEAISLAGITSDTVTFIEAHGTGTELGDPVEIAALNKAFRLTAKDPDHQARHFCAIASTKPNIGHLNHASGIASLLKTILTLKNRQIPPSLNFETPNPKIDFENSPFFVNVSLRDWQPPDGLPRRAGVNAFGIGGTNAHVVMEEAPTAEPSGDSRPWQMVLLSAKTATALDTISTHLAKYLQEHPALKFADVAYTLQVGRKPLPYRRMLVCQNTIEAINTLATLNPKQLSNSLFKGIRPSVAFMFSGQGSQYVNMAKQLYDHEIVFRTHLDECAEILIPHLGFDLRQVLYPSVETAETATEKLQQTALTQPALFVIEYALAKLWTSWGIQPQAMIGHSIGEYVAACIADVFSLEDALALVATRGKMMQEMSPGTMLSISLPAAKVESLLGDQLALCVINAPSSCVVGGQTSEIAVLEQKLTEIGVDYQRLHTSHAFHSPMMEPLLESFTARVAQVTLHPPQIPYISNLTGTWIRPEEATDPAYWARHLRHTVRFADGIQLLLQDSQRVLLEVGPGRVLSGLARQQATQPMISTILTSVRHPHEEIADQAFILNTLGKLWLAGVPPDWTAFYANEQRHRLPLPTYPFERQRYWIDPPKPGGNEVFTRPQLSLSMLGELDRAMQDMPLNPINLDTYVAPRNAKEEKIARIWQDVLGSGQVSIHDNFFELGGSSLLGSRVVAELCKAMNIELLVQTFLNAPTIAELAELIEDQPEHQEHAKITAKTTPATTVKLRGGDGRKQALFLIHPIDGFAYFYRDLAYALEAGRPVYAFQAQGLESGTQPIDNIEKMAKFYLETMRTLQPQGPYLLGGFSFGGVVAFEMAQQLRSNGEDIKLLFLSDTPPTHCVLFDLQEDTAILRFAIKYLLKLDSEMIHWDELRGQPLASQIQVVLSTVKGQKNMPFMVDADMLQRLIQVMKIHQQALSTYQPKPYLGKIVFFRAQEVIENVTLGQAERFWLDFAAGGIEINNVPGNHLTMNYQPQVQVLATALRRNLG